MPDKSIREAIAAAEAQVQEPASLEQREAGNYQKGHFTWCGLGITLETAKGTTRRGTDPSGHEWSVKLKNSYGYIKGTDSAEVGDEMDVFVGDEPETELVFVVDQNKNGQDQFDEHKCVIGCSSSAAARSTYESNYSPGWKGFRSVTPLTVPQFRAWLENGDMTKPLKGQKFETFCKVASWEDVGRTLRQQMPGFHPVDAAVGAAAAGIPAYLLTAADRKNRKNRWRNAAIAALLGGTSANLVGDRARRYLSNLPGVFGYDPMTLINPAKREGLKGLLDGAILDKPINAVEGEDAFKSPGAWKPMALARRELFRRALNVHAPTKDDFFQTVGKTFEAGKWRDELQIAPKFVGPLGALSPAGSELWKDILHPEDWRNEVSSAPEGFAPTTSYIFANMPVRRMGGIEQIRDVWDFALQGGELNRLKELVASLVRNPRDGMSKLDGVEADELLRSESGTKLKAISSMLGREVLDKVVAPSAPVFRQNFSVNGDGPNYLDKVRVLLDTPTPLPDDALNAKLLAGGAGLLGAAALTDHVVNRPEKKEKKASILGTLAKGVRHAAGVPKGQAFAPSLGAGARNVLKLGFNPELGRVGNVGKRLAQGAGLYGLYSGAKALEGGVKDVAGEAARLVPDTGKLAPTNQWLESMRDKPWSTGLTTAAQGFPRDMSAGQQALIRSVAELGIRAKLHDTHLPGWKDMAQSFYAPAMPPTQSLLQKLVSYLVRPPQGSDYNQVAGNLLRVAGESE